MWPQAVWHLLVTTKTSIHSQFPVNTRTLWLLEATTYWGKKKKTQTRKSSPTQLKRGRKIYLENKTGTKNMFLCLSERQVNTLLSP